MALQADNAVVRTWGGRREEADLHNHVDLVEMLDIVDLDKGVAIAGTPGLTLQFFACIAQWVLFVVCLQAWETDSLCNSQGAQRLRPALPSTEQLFQ